MLTLRKPHEISGLRLENGTRDWFSPSFAWILESAAQRQRAARGSFDVCGAARASVTCVAW